MLPYPVSCIILIADVLSRTLLFTEGHCTIYRGILCVLTTLILRGLDILGNFSAIFYKGDNFCDFRFAFLHTKSLLQRGLLQRERICSHGEQILYSKHREQIISFKSKNVAPMGWGQILSFKSSLLFRRDVTNFSRVTSPLKVYPFPLTMQKRVFRHIRTAKAQISLHIHVV